MPVPQEQQPVEQQPIQQSQPPVELQVEQNQPRPGSPESETPESGYLSDRRVEAPVEAPQGDFGGNNLEELSERLGVNPDEVGLPPQPEPQKEEPKLSTEDWYNKQFGTEEAKQFADNFKKHFGMDIKEVYTVINQTAQVTQGLEQWRQQVQAQRQVESLKQEWGSEFDNIMPQVAQRFQHIQKVNPQQARALDNLDGARMLAALIRQEQSQGGQQPNLAQTPTYLPNRRNIQRTTSQPNVVKMSDYVSMNDQEAQQINAGLMNGSIQIIRDM